jgi:hypothetical protein
MKTKKLTIGFVLALLGSFAHAQSGLDSIIVEKYYVADSADSYESTNAGAGALPIGSVTYRIYADLAPGYNFQALYGVNSPLHELKLITTTTFFNNEDRGTTNANGIPSAQLKNNTNALDSWFSVGAAATGQLGVLKSEDNGAANLISANTVLKNNSSAIGIPLTTQDGMMAGTTVSVTFVGLSIQLNVFDATSLAGSLFSTTNGSIAALGGVTGPTSSNRVLVGQFTTDGDFCYELNLQIGTPTGGFENYVAKNPSSSEFSVPSLMGCITAASSTTSIAKNTSEENEAFKIYPNPAKDLLTVEITSASKQNNVANGYAIYGVQGNEIIHNTLGTISEKQKENIDISSLKPGMYFVKITVDGVVTTKKIIKN